MAMDYSAVIFCALMPEGFIEEIAVRKFAAQPPDTCTFQADAPDRDLLCVYDLAPVVSGKVLPKIFDEVIGKTGLPIEK